MVMQYVEVAHHPLADLRMEMKQLEHIVQVWHAEKQVCLQSR